MLLTYLINSSLISSSYIEHLFKFLYGLGYPWLTYASLISKAYLGLKRYKIGHKPFQTLNSELSQKEKSISEFKSGFGAELVAEPQLKKMK